MIGTPDYRYCHTVVRQLILKRLFKFMGTPLKPTNMTFRIVEKSVSVRSSHLVSSHPPVRQQLVDRAGSLGRQALQHIFQVGIRVMPIQLR